MTSYSFFIINFMLLFSFWDDVIKPILDGLVSQFVSGMASGIPKLISALIIFFIGLTIARFVRNVVAKVLSALGIDKFTKRLNEIDLVQSAGVEVQLSQVIAKVVHFFIVFMFTMMTIDVLHIEAISKLMQDTFDYLPSLLTAGVILVIGL